MPNIKLDLKQDFKQGAVYKLPTGICGVINDKITLLGKNSEVEFLGVNEQNDFLFKIIKPADLKGKTLLVLTISAFSPLFEEVDKKEGNTVFKPGDKVELFRSNVGNKIGRVFTFVGYLPEAVGNLDCVCKTAEGASTFGISDNLKLVDDKPKMNSQKEIDGREALQMVRDNDLYINLYRTDNKITALYFDKESRKLFKGEARCNPKDDFNLVLGAAIAVARATGDTESEEALVGE